MKPSYELHFAIKAVVWDNGSITWEHAGEMYECAYPNGTVWDYEKQEWDFYRDNNETVEVKCHGKLSSTLMDMTNVNLEHPRDAYEYWLRERSIRANIPAL